MWRLRLLVVISIVFLGSCKCTQGVFNAPVEVYIGEYSSLSGAMASFGINTHLGIQLALKEYNARSSETGYVFKLITIDNEGDEKKAADAVKKLIDQKVIAVIGEVSSDLSVAGARVAQMNKIPMISPGSTHAKVTEVGDYIFRACFVDTFQGTVMAKFAFEDLKATRVAVFRDSKLDYSTALADFFIKKFKALGGTITVDLSYKKGDLDFKEQLLKISQTSPDAIYLPGYYTEVGLVARQARKLGINAKLLGGDGWDSTQIYNIAEDAINGGFFSNHFAVESPEEQAKSFVQKFRNEYALVPDANAALAYDTANLLVSAILKTKTPTPELVRNEISKTTKFPGATGEISFTQGRDPVKSAVIVRVDGKINRFEKTVTP